MNWIKFPHQQLILPFAFALVLVSLTSSFTRIQAQPTKPVVSTVRFVPPPLPERGTPTGRQRGGASRGQCPDVNKPLTALVPATQNILAARQGGPPALFNLEYVWGLTVAERPTLWFYVPYTLTPDLSIEFVLQDEQDNDVYETSFKASQTPPGIIKFRLPSTAAPLEVGKMYHWYLSIYCNSNTPIFVEGWVQRNALDPTDVNWLQKATPRQRIDFYAANGIWYDALTALAEQRSANPQDATLRNDWVSLLQPVGLDAIAREPISQCCTPEN